MTVEFFYCPFIAGRNLSSDETAPVVFMGRLKYVPAGELIIADPSTPDPPLAYSPTRSRRRPVAFGPLGAPGHEPVTGADVETAYGKDYLTLVMRMGLDMARDEPARKPIDLLLVARRRLVSIRGPVCAAGHPIAAASGRDSDIEFKPGVFMIGGWCEAGGSRKDWETIVGEGSAFRVIGFPADAVASINNFDWWSERLHVSKPDRNRICELRDSLVLALAEIDRALEIL